MDQADALIKRIKTLQNVPNEQKPVNPGLTRKNIVQYIVEQNKKKVKKITPVTPALYKKAYVDYVCSKLRIKESEVPPSVYSDVKNIKTYYVAAHKKIPAMIKQHQKFFDTIIQPKRAASPPPAATVCFLEVSIFFNFFVKIKSSPDFSIDFYMDKMMIYY